MAEPGRLVLEGLDFHAHHGARAEEASLGARFTVDLELGLQLAEDDTLESTVDYSRVYALVSDLVTGSRHRLIESLAAAIARRVLESEPLVQWTVVRVHKPHAPLPGVVGDVFAEVRRDRDG